MQAIVSQEALDTMLMSFLCALCLGTRAEKLFDLLYEQPLNTAKMIVSRLSQKLEDWYYCEGCLSQRMLWVV